MRCVESVYAMAAVRSGQGCLSLCGEKRELWLPKFLTHTSASETFCLTHETQRVEVRDLKKTAPEHFSRPETLLLHERTDESVHSDSTITVKDSVQSLGKRPSKITKIDKASFKRQVLL